MSVSTRKKLVLCCLATAATAVILWRCWPPTPAGAGMAAAAECTACGHRWTTTWDRVVANGYLDQGYTPGWRIPCPACNRPAAVSIPGAATVPAKKEWPHANAPG